jgi:hypothetical protein
MVFIVNVLAILMLYLIGKSRGTKSFRHLRKPVAACPVELEFHDAQDNVLKSLEVRLIR